MSRQVLQFGPETCIAWQHILTLFVGAAQSESLAVSASLMP